MVTVGAAPVKVTLASRLLLGSRTAMEAVPAITGISPPAAAAATVGGLPRRPLANVGNAPPELLAKTVGDLELSVRSRKALQRLNINTLGELASRTEDELLGCKNFGHTSLNEIKQQLTSFGLGLRKLDA